MVANLSAFALPAFLATLLWGIVNSSMTGFDPRSSGVDSNHSARCATATGQVHSSCQQNEARFRLAGAGAVVVSQSSQF